MEAKKVEFGCCVGVPVGLFVAWLFAPLFWWLGILAGFCAGYSIYDLREIPANAPLAWKRAKKRSIEFLNLLKKPRPFFYPFLIVGATLIFSIPKFMWTHQGFFFKEETVLTKKIFTISVVSFFLFIPVESILLLSMFKLAEYGAKRKGKWYYAPADRVYLFGTSQFEPVSYKNIYGFMFVGLIYSLLLGVMAMPKILGFVFCEIWMLIGRFVWHLVKLIHSQGRVICGIDCALGVFITYKLFGHGVETTSELGLLLVCGAVIGWTIGHIHCKIAQLTGLAPVTNNQ